MFEETNQRFSDELQKIEIQFQQDAGVLAVIMILQTGNLFFLI